MTKRSRSPSPEPERQARCVRPPLRRSWRSDFLDACLAAAAPQGSVEAGSRRTAPPPCPPGRPEDCDGTQVRQRLNSLSGSVND
eukprot:10474235-Alexandrium_andersonii.AAC.1